MARAWVWCKEKVAVIEKHKLGVRAGCAPKQFRISARLHGASGKKLKRLCEDGD
jgi:hypothetical protein